MNKNKSVGGTKMNEREVLWSVLDYHYNENLKDQFQYIGNGVFTNPMRKNEKVIPGLYENHNIHPTFVVVNGTKFAKELTEQRLIKKKEIEYEPISTKDDFVNYMHENSLRDGAFILENYERIGRLGIIDNSISKGVDLSDVYPSTFLSESENYSTPLDECGGRTQAAGAVSKKFTHLPVHVCFIKATAVNETATGTIAYLGPNGLEEEIIFKYAPELRNKTYKADGQEHNYTYLDDGTSIIGVHRKYTKVDGNFVLLGEQYIGRSNGSFVLQPSANEYSSIEDSLTSPLPQSGAMPIGYRSGIEGLVSGTETAKKVMEPCYSN